MQRKWKETKQQDQPSPQPLLEMPPDPPRHAPRPPRSPPTTAAMVDLDHLTACGNHNAKAKEGNKCKSRGSLHNTRTYPNRRRDLVAPHPRTLRKGNPGDFPQLYRLDDEYFPLRPPPRKGGRSKYSTSKSFFQIAPTIDDYSSKPPPRWTTSAYTIETTSAPQPSP